MAQQNDIWTKELGDGPAFQLLGKIIFPSFDELQLMAMVSAIVVFLGLHHEKVGDIASKISWEPQAALAFIFIIGSLLVLIYHILSYKTLSVSSKVIACALYYVFFAFAAYSTLHTLNIATAQPAGFFERFNIVLTKIILVVSIIRGAIALLLMRLNDYRLNKVLASRMHDTQYKPLAFIAIFILVSVMTYVFRGAYPDQQVRMFIAASYSMIVISTFKLFVSWFVPSTFH